MPDAERHRAIEAFLAQVDERLRLLPVARRASEREELAQHLDLLVASYRASGRDEAAAARAAVERFGRAERIGQELRGAWRREADAPFDYARWFTGYIALIWIPYLGICWFSGDSMGLPVAFATGNMVLTPAIFYAADYKRRRSARAHGEGNHA
jgi:hypothetical protein